MSPRQIFPALFLGVLFSSTAAPAQEVRIVAADGQVAADGRVGQVMVRPGQVVSLTADEVSVDEEGSLEYAYRPVQDFLWSADDAASDSCDPQEDCRKASRFEATEYGVNFYVPAEAPERITITAKLRWGEGADSVVLVNEVVQQAAAVPGGEAASEASAETPMTEAYLDGLGHWVVIGGQRVFVPIGAEDDWAPYRHGYWYWTSYGWTWYSYDPWGYVTDHCGHWRHSWVYGWVWVPELVCAWRPAIVTFYYGSGWVGWYPYDPGWRRGYWHGYAHGYDDGYWMGGHGHRGPHATHPGYTAVAHNDFYVPGRRDPSPPDRRGYFSHRMDVPDISRVHMRDYEDVRRKFEVAEGEGRRGRQPGGDDPASSRQWYERNGGARPSETAMKPAWDDSGRHGKSAWMDPVEPPHETPAEYRDSRRRTMERTAAASRQPGVRDPVGRASPAATGRGGEGIASRAGVTPTGRGDEGRATGTGTSRAGNALVPRFSGTGRDPLRTWTPRDPVRDPAVGSGTVREGRGEVRPGTGSTGVSGAAEPAVSGFRKPWTVSPARIPTERPSVNKAGSSRWGGGRPGVPEYWELPPDKRPGSRSVANPPATNPNPRVSPATERRPAAATGTFARPSGNRAAPQGTQAPASRPAVRPSSPAPARSPAVTPSSAPGRDSAPASSTAPRASAPRSRSSGSDTWSSRDSGASRSVSTPRWGGSSGNSGRSFSGTFGSRPSIGSSSTSSSSSSTTYYGNRPGGGRRGGRR